MLEAAEKQQIPSISDPEPKARRAALEVRIQQRLPYYTLIERIRIHDFHRFGIVPPDPALQETMFGGPVKLQTQGGMASVALTASGPQAITTGNSSVEQQRPLLIHDGMFFDEGLSKYVNLDEILGAFLSNAPSVIADFERLVGGR
jgi:hypothetical protein